MSPVRVLCVDDNEEILGALRLHLARMEQFEVIGSLLLATELAAAVDKHHPDIVVLDLDMPGQSPLEALRKMNASGAPPRTVIFSGHVRPSLIAEAMDAGAWGYVSKNDGVAELVAAIRSILAGQVVWSPEVLAVLTHG